MRDGDGFAVPCFFLVCSNCHGNASSFTPYPPPAPLPALGLRECVYFWLPLCVPLSYSARYLCSSREA